MSKDHLYRGEIPYSRLRNAYGTYKDHQCRVTQVPHSFINHFTIRAEVSNVDIGNGAGCSVDLSPLEFEELFKVTRLYPTA